MRATVAMMLPMMMATQSQTDKTRTNDQLILTNDGLPPGKAQRNKSASSKICGDIAVD